MSLDKQCLAPQPGEWVKGKMVGSGSFGTVHLAMSKATGGLFVVKSAQEGPGLKSLENEATMLEKLHSPYIVRCMGRDSFVGRQGEGRLNLFMEYMAGGSLSNVADKFGGILEEKVIRLYTREILQGLKYLHKNEIVHCDLKCQNVLLGSSGNVKLADFGCAKRLRDLKSKGASMTSWQSISGTPLWMAPEVLRNEGVTLASDIWSLGCTIIEMATGRPPWSGEVSNPMAAVMMIACSNKIPQIPTHLSKEGLDFLAKCLDRNPAKRWTAEELLSHPFVSRHLERENLRKEDFDSPKSIQDVRNHEDGSDSDQPECVDGCGFFRRISFSKRHGCKRKKMNKKSQKQLVEGDLASSGNWVTVRSG